MVNNFKEAAVCLGQERKTPVKCCQDVGLSRLAKSTGAAMDLSLRVFFSANTYKDGVPFMDVVSEGSKDTSTNLVDNDPFNSIILRS